MGKNNKKPSTNPGAGKAESSSAQESSASDWLSSLTPEEQEQERAKQKARDEKASAEKKKQEEDMQRRAYQEAAHKRSEVRDARASAKFDKQWLQFEKQAMAEGILKSVEGEDGCWYIEFEGDWKWVNDQYYCKYCDAHLNYSSLESHLKGGKHQRKLGASGISTTPMAPMAPAGFALCRVRSNNALEVWQEDDGEGGISCKACNKRCDGVHEHTEEHKRKLESFMWFLHADEQVYLEPEQEWLAWVEDRSYGSGRFLRCLLCKKWVQDFEGMDTTGYCGQHGHQDYQNQKDHARKLNNISCYRIEMQEEKRKWHPPASSAAACNGNATNAVQSQPLITDLPASKWHPSASSAAADNGNATDAVQSQPQITFLAGGWHKVWSDEYENFYYYKADGTVQWELPTEVAATEDEDDTYDV